MKRLISRHSFFSRERSRNCQGFTLVEVMVAISVLSIVLMSVYGVFKSVNAAKGRLDSDSHEYHLARVVFDRFSRELQGAYYRTGDEATLFEGGKDQHGYPFLALTTTAVTPMSKAGTGIAEVKYRLVPDKANANNKHVLLRSERPRISQETVTDDLMMRMAPSVESLSFRFFSGRAWQDEWDAVKFGLPQLVEVALIVDGEHQQTAFRTTIDIPDVSKR